MDSQSESWDSGGPHQFPAGLRVLVVDDDATCLKVIERMLKKCQYTVTTCSRAVMALEILRENKEGFDIVLSDVHMPDMDGFKLLVHIGLEMDLPVIMMSADDGKDVVMKGVTHGACDYLIKPVSMKALQNIWQHVFRKKRSEVKDLDDSGSLDDGDKQKKPLDDGDSASSGSWKVAKRKKEGGDEDELEDSSALKKSRVVWSVDLHQRFVAAVNQLGLEKAVPKKILELMNEPTLTRENVASHLQKYRLYLKRLSVPQHQGRADTSFSSPADASFNQGSSFDGFDLQALVASGQIPPQTLMTLHPVPRRVPNNSMGMPTVDQRGFLHSDVRSAMVQKLNNNQMSLYSIPRLAANPSMCMPTSDQRVFFNSDAQLANSSHMRPRMMQQLNNNQMSDLYGSSTSMVPRHIGQAQQVFQVSEGTQGFMNLPSSLGTDSPFPGGSVGHLTHPFVTQMNQQGQQISLAQQQDPIQYGVQKQPQSRGQLLGGISNGKQMVSNGLTNHVFVRKGAEVKGVAPLQGNYMTMPQSGTVPQSLYSNVQNGNTSTSNCHPHVSSIVVPPGGLATLSNATGLTHDIYSDLHQSKNECWKLQNGNHSFETKQRDVDYDFSLIDHHDSNAILEDGAAINSCTVGKEIFDGQEIKHEKVEYFSQDHLFSDDCFPNELMSVVKR